MNASQSRPLAELITRLQKEGFAVSTAEALDAARLLVKLAEREAATITPLPNAIELSPSPGGRGVGVRAKDVCNNRQCPDKSTPFALTLPSPAGRGLLSSPSKLQLPETPNEAPAGFSKEILLQHLRPLLCKSSDPARQQRFDAIFQEWWWQGSTTPATQQQADDSTTAPVTPEQPKQPYRNVVLLGIFLLVLTLISGWLYISQKPDAANTTPPSAESKPEAPTPEVSDKPTLIKIEAPASRIYGYWPAYRYTETLRPALAWLLVTAPLSLLVFFSLPAWALGRRRGSGGAGIVLQGWDRDTTAKRLVPPLAADVISRFDRHIRGPANEIRRLARRPPIDLIRTVNATLANIGIPQMRYRYARLRPEYLLLVDAASDDALPMLWAERLQKQGLAVDLRRLQIPSDGSVPIWRIKTSGATGRFDQLPKPNDGQRLILVSDGAFLLDKNGNWRPWARAAQLERWPVRTLFSPKEPRDMLQGRLNRLDAGLRPGDPGFLVLPQEESALSAWSTWLASGHMPVIVPAEAQRFPRLIAERGEQRYLTGASEQVSLPSADEVARLIAELHVYLGENGFYWLCCCAIPPLMHNGLTLLLGEEYLRRAGASGEESLRYHLTRNYRLLARLPWLRYNHMPDWLRLALLARLTDSLQQEMRDVVDGLLSRQKPDLSGNLRLGFDAPGTTSGPGAVSGSPQTTDALYLGFMSGLSARELLLRMPGQWQPWLQGINRNPRLSRQIRDWLTAGFARLLFRQGLPGTGAARFSLLTGWLVTALSVIVLTSVALFPPEHWPGLLREALFVEEAVPLVFQHDGLVHEISFIADTNNPNSGTTQNKGNNYLLQTVTSDNTIRQWNMQTGALQYQRRSEFLNGVSEHKNEGLDKVLSPDGKLKLELIDDKTAQLLVNNPHEVLGKQKTLDELNARRKAQIDKIENKRLEVQNEINGNGITHIKGFGVFSKKLADELTMLNQELADIDKQIKEVSMDSQVRQTIGEPLQHEVKINHAIFSPDGQQIAIASEDGTIRLWSSQVGNTVGKPMQHEKFIYHAAFSPDGRKVVTASLDGTARLWDSKTGAPLGKLMRHGGAVQYATFSSNSDGRLVVTASEDKTARLWSAQTGMPTSEPLRHEGMVWYAEFSPDDQSVVTASADKSAQLWDAQTGKPIGQPLKHEEQVYLATFSPDGQRILTFSDDKIAKLWDTKTGASLEEPLWHTEWINHAAFSPDGQQVITAGWDSTARLWNIQTGALIGKLLQHENMINHAAFSPDGRRIVTASSDYTARQWDAQTGVLLGSPLQHEGSVLQAKFSPDGQRIVTASADHTTRLWDSKNGTLLGVLPAHGEVRTAAFHPDGNRVLVSDGIPVNFSRTTLLKNNDSNKLMDDLSRFKLLNKAAKLLIDFLSFDKNKRQGKIPQPVSAIASNFNPFGEARIWRIPPYPEPQPIFQFSAKTLQTVAIALPVLALLLGLIRYYFTLRLLRQRLGHYVLHQSPA